MEEYAALFGTLVAIGEFHTKMPYIKREFVVQRVKRPRLKASKTGLNYHFSIKFIFKFNKLSF